MKRKAYAKINLSLKVLEKRKDNYHNLDTLMINVNLYDILYFKKCKDVLISSNINICEKEDNLVYKAVTLLKKKFNISKGINIYIKKRIPMGAGLGGGSSDAATTLCALNKIWKLNLSIDELKEIALSLGSDVPFFLYNQFSRVMGRGEKIINLNNVFKKKILLVSPNFNISTKKVFENHIITKNNMNIPDVYKALLKGEYCLFNDLETSVISLYPEYVLKELRENIEKLFACSVLMSGSGSSIFIISEKQTKKIYKYMKKNFPFLNIKKNKTISYCKRNCD